jgi:hypothetical protein
MIAKLGLRVPLLCVQDRAGVPVFLVYLNCQTARLVLSRPLNRTQKLKDLMPVLRRWKKSEF